VKCRVLVLIPLLAASGAFAGEQPVNPLQPCPNKPNCVSTADPSATHGFQPLPFHGTLQQTREDLVRLIGAMPRGAIVQAQDSYIHATFTSRLLGFVDDLEFYFDESKQVVQMRSASRSGYYDFGVNKGRLEDVVKAWGSVPH